MNWLLEPAAAWLVHSAVGGSLVLLVTLLVMSRVRQPALKQRVGEVGLAAALLVGVLCLLPAWWVLPRFDPEPQDTPPVSPPTVENAPAVAADPPAGVPNHPPAIPAGGPVPPVAEGSDLPPGDDNPAPAAVDPVAAVQTVALSVYVAGAAWFLGRLALAFVSLYALRRGAQPAPEAVVRLLERMCPSGAVPRVWTSSRLRVPLSFGLFRPTILLPAGVCVAGVRQLRWVLRHEMTHLRRGDPWSGLLWGLAQAVYFPVPWLRAVGRQVRLAREFVADAASVDGPGEGPDYAEFLLSFTRSPTVPLVAAGVSGSSSDLFRRVHMLLERPVPVGQKCPRLPLFGLGGGLLAVALVVSGVGLEARADPTVVVITGGDAKVAKLKALKDLQDQGIRVVVVPGPEEKAEKPRMIWLKKGDGPIEVEIELPDVLKKAPAGPGIWIEKLDQDRLRQGQKFEVEIERVPVPAPRDVLFLKKFDPGWEHVEKALEKLKDLKGQEGVEEVRRELEKALQQLRGQPPAIRWHLETDALQPKPRLGLHLEVPGDILAEHLNLPDGQGMVITGVEPDSPAEKAGLRKNDILLQVASQPVPRDVAKLVEVVEGIKAGQAFDAVVLRKGERRTVEGLKLADVKGVRARVLAVPVPPPAPSPPKAPGRPAAVAVPDIRFELRPPAVDPQSPPLRRAETAAPGGVMLTTFRNRERFNTRYQEGDLVINVTGKIAAKNRAEVEEVHVRDGGKATTYPSVAEVPARYRDKVEHMVDMTERNQVRVEATPAR